MRFPTKNTDKDRTAASMQRMADVMAKEKAQLWINHDKDTARQPEAVAGLFRVIWRRESRQN